MKYTIFILLYSTLFLVNNVQCLTGGTAAVLGAFPSHALVLVGGENGDPFGGTLVNQNHVVTACGVVLDDQNFLRAIGVFHIRVGGIAFNTGNSTGVSAVFPHPEYNPWTHNHDIAVLRTVVTFDFDTTTPNPNIAPAIFNDRVIADATECFVVGFNRPEGVIVPQLQQLLQPILNRDATCNLAANHNGRALETMLCAGVTVANQGICPSTRGGGIYCNGIFAGVASTGLGCGQAGSPGLYTQVRHHRAWIQAQFTRTQLPGPGPTHPPGVSAATFTVVTSSLLICLAFFFSKLLMY